MANAISSLSYNNNTYPFTLPYGECTTAAATKAKTVTVPNFSLEVGATVIVKFRYASGVASPTLNVNGTGAKAIYRYGYTYDDSGTQITAGAAASTGTSTTGWRAGAVQMFTYDGKGWVRDFWENSTYSNASMGSGYGTCDTEEDTTAKAVTLSSYALTTGGIVAVKFTYAVPASATMNINSKGAKAIYYRGAAITAGVIKAGDVATFIYNGSQYHLLTVDRDENTTYSAAGSSLGLVKSGGDVTISSGVITVNDDSHNHTIANVDNLQSTLDGKQATITGGASTIASSNLTASRALVSDSSGKVAVSAVTSTELGYLGGVTSAVQTQINSKAPTSHASTATTYGIGTGSNYGHVKLSDATNSTSAASSGIAASPAAVKAAYDLADGKADASHTHSSYAPKASPALTGTPTAPTATAGTNTTQIATTAFVTNAVSGKADSEHDHVASNITSGTLSSDRLPTVPVTKGGTGAADATTARTNLGITPANIGAVADTGYSPIISGKTTRYTVGWYRALLGKPSVLNINLFASGDEVQNEACAMQVGLDPNSSFITMIGGQSLQAFKRVRIVETANGDIAFDIYYGYNRAVELSLSAFGVTGVENDYPEFQGFTAVSETVSGETIIKTHEITNETLTTAQVRNIYAGTSDLTAGTSTLATGVLYFVYE